MDQDLLTHPLINAEARQRLFRKLVGDVRHYPDGVEFSLALPYENMQNLARKESDRKQLIDHVHSWLNCYFPDAPIYFENALGRTTFVVNNERISLPTMRISMEGPAALKRFDALMGGRQAMLPDYQHLVHELDSPEARKHYLMERVMQPDNDGEHKPKENPHKLGGVFAGQVHVDFSVPRGRGGELRDEFWSQYGKEVTFKGPTGNGLMVKVGATLKGETAKQFLSDYNHYRGRD